MSLDVYLHSTDGTKVPRTGSGIFLRENGMVREVSNNEWEARFPERNPVTVIYDSTHTDELYSANVTHNLNTMAEHAGIYWCLWRPDEHDITEAAQLIEPLRKGLAHLKGDPARYKQYEPANKWGTYEQFVAFVEAYLAACERYPTARVSVWR